MDFMVNLLGRVGMRAISGKPTGGRRTADGGEANLLVAEKLSIVDHMTIAPGIIIRVVSGKAMTPR
jgi:hypothetical protein